MNKTPSFIWKLQDLSNIFPHKHTVFSCFAGGGGSSMGYKLAGFNVIGCNEIDKRAIQCYKENLAPKYLFEEPIQEFKKRKRFPKSLYNLDILDGSPPCTVFSLAGNKSDDWGKKRKYNEGAFEQVLDTLFFDYIELAERLYPKIVISENVEAMLWGETKRYVQRVCEEFKKAGYTTIYKLLDASYMGIPQKRRRIFFFSVRNDLVQYLPIKGFAKELQLNLDFNETPITFKQMAESVKVTKKGTELTPLYQKYWKQSKQGTHVGKHVNCKKMAMNCVPFAQTTGNYFHPTEMRKLGLEEYIAMASFPQDYDFCGFSLEKCRYITGMCVPPIMMFKIASEVKTQWLDKLSCHRKEKKRADSSTKPTTTRPRKRKRRSRIKRTSGTK